MPLSIAQARLLQIVAVVFGVNAFAARLLQTFVSIVPDKVVPVRATGEPLLTEPIVQTPLSDTAQPSGHGACNFGKGSAVFLV